MWNLISSYPLDKDGLGETVPVAWKRDGGRVIRMANGVHIEGVWAWYDSLADEELEPPDFWFALPALRSSEAWAASRT